jgi:hypothetical protein
MESWVVKTTVPVSEPEWKALRRQGWRLVEDVVKRSGWWIYRLERRRPPAEAGRTHQ